MAEADRPAPVHQDAGERVLRSGGMEMFKYASACVRVCSRNLLSPLTQTRPDFVPGFAERNRWRAEGRRDRGCSTQGHHPQTALTASPDAGPTLW